MGHVSWLPVLVEVYKRFKAFFVFHNFLYVDLNSSFLWVTDVDSREVVRVLVLLVDLQIVLLYSDKFC